MKKKAVSGIMLTLLLTSMYSVLLLSMFAVAPIQSQEEPQYVDLSYLVPHIEDFKGIIIMTNGTAIRHTEYHIGGFFLEAPDGTGIKVSLGGLPNQGLPANLTVVVVVGWVYYSPMLYEWEFVAESWWPQYADWITVKDLLVEMSIENTTTPLGEELSILMVAPEGGTCPDTQIFNVYLYDSNYSLFSYWSQDKGAYFVVTGVDPGYKETLRWDLFRYEGGEHCPPPPGDYYLVGAIMTGWDGLLPTELTPPILIRIDNSTITPIAKPWTVDDDEPADFHTIQEAINAANPGDTILVSSGTYYEHVIVNKPLTLVGKHRSTTIIDGNGTGTVVHVIANNVSLRGFTIQNSGSHIGLYFSGIYLDNTERCNITENSILNNAYGIRLRYSSNNTVSRNIINSSLAVWLQWSSCNTVSGNNVTKSEWYGIWLDYSSNNVISGNNVTNGGYYGIRLYSSSNNIFRSNSMVNNKYNFHVYVGFVNDIDTSNTVDGKPVYYWIDERDKAVPLEAGYVALVNCTSITVQNLNLTKNYEGLLMAFTTNSTISGNDVTNNFDGILLHSSSHNTLSGNNVTNNYLGISLYRSSNNNSVAGNNIVDNEHGISLYNSFNNKFYHNNFINNTQQVHDCGWESPPFLPSINIWDDGYPSGGNYWSDYAGQDLDGDGIGDTPYPIDVDNEDRYPLMGPINAFDAGTWSNIAYSVNVASNSTVTDLYFNPDEGSFIRFNITGPDGTTGFCRVAIPKQLLSVGRPEEWIVMVGDDVVGLEVSEDENYTYLYFTYPHSTKTVIITGTRAIPEFPTWTPILLILLLLSIAIAIYKRRLLKTPIH